MTTCTGSQRTNHPKDRPAPDTRVLQLSQSPPAAPDLEPVQDEYERAALAWAQEWGYDGDRLPSGWRMQPAMCPLGRAVHLSIAAGNAYRIGTSTVVAELPPRVHAFVRRFDCEHYPHLDVDVVGE